MNRGTWEDYGSTTKTAMLGILAGFQDTVDEFYASGESHTEDLLKALEFAERFPPATTYPILEFGCGMGRLTHWLAPHFSRVVAVDFSANMIARAKENYPGDDGNTTFLHAPDLMLPAVWEQAPYRYILSLIVFQHMDYEDVFRTFERAHEILELGGVLHTQMDWGPRRSVHKSDQITVRSWDMNVLQSYLNWSDKKWQVLNPLSSVEGTSEKWHWLTMKKL